MRSRHFFVRKKSLGRRLLIKLLLFAVAFVCVSMLIYFVGSQGKTTLATAIEEGELVRLHILANDDSRNAQDTKLYVRDRVLESLAPVLSGAKSAKQAEKLVIQNMDLALEEATQAAREKGFEGEVKACFGVYDFPDKSYAGHFVPAGQYKALRIVLGEGQGQNWWCVMYPPLCFVGEEAVEMDDIQFESAILKWFRSLSDKKEESK